MHYILKRVEARNNLMSLQSWQAITIFFNKLIGVKLMKQSGWYYENKTAWWVGNSDDYLRSRLWLIGKIKKDSNYGKKFAKKQLDSLNNFIKSFPRMMREASLCPEEKIISFAKKFINKATKTSSLAFFTDWYAHDAQHWIYDYINKSELNDRVFRTLTSNKKLSFSKEYEYRLALIKIKEFNNKITKSKNTNSGVKDVDKEIKKLVQQMTWAMDNYYHVGTINSKRVKHDLDKMKLVEAKDIIKEIKKLPGKVKKQKALLNSLSLNKFQKALIDLLSDFVDVQDKRKAAVFVTNNVITCAFEKILDLKKIFGASRQLVLEHASADWILDFDKKKLLRLSSLAEKGILKLADSKEIIGKKAHDQFQKILGLEINNIKEFKGYSACLGKVRGKVSIVHAISDFVKFKGKDILVASMTRPEMLPVIKKCSAIITDEGGLTCHAAIISRELHKPCIIATKIASRVLHDGDEVEVDANQGIVRILK
jgi:phosphoenolpyruvate synthase/pyruvate phosphate dikinase